MDAEQIERRRKEIIQQHGEWTADNFQLFGDIYTIGKDSHIGSGRQRRITQIISDLFHDSFENLRILDLGSLEGGFAVEFAKRGAEVTAVELRQGNLVKSRFAKDVLSLDNLDFVQDDVRNLSAEKYGTFDVVLASGILYHLNAPDVFYFVENISQVCRKVAIIDTLISVSPDTPYAHREKTYWGWHFTEYAHEPTPEEVENKPWLAVGNVKSFWLTRPSLFNLMADSGFTSVYECHIPVHVPTGDRVTLVGVKGQTQHLISRPTWSESHVERYPEEPADITPDQKYHLTMKQQGPVQKTLRALVSSLPESLKRPLRSMAKAVRPKS